MTIETGPATVVRTTANDTVKGKSGSGHEAGGTTKGGFMALLASLDAAADAASSAMVAGDTALDPKTLGGKTGVGTHGKRQVPGAGTLGDGAAGADAAKALAGAADSAATVDGAASDASARSDLPPDAAALLAQSAQWLPTAVPNAGAAKPIVGSAAAADSLAGAKLPHPNLKSDNALVPTVAAGDTAVAAAGKAAKSQKDTATRLAAADTATTSLAGSTQQPDPRALQSAAKTVDIPMAPIAMALAAASTSVPARRDDPSRERSVFRANASDGSTISQPYLPTASTTSVQTTPDAPTATDTLVADKVAYWISNDVQNAQMKLDGIGDKPVEVSIRMQGNEAHIAFRTDELQAQTALENASVHLKDLLQREGLVLSGVSVGGSGAGGAGEQERGSRQGMRQVVVTSVQAASGADRNTGMSRVTGGALDLFV